MILYIGNKLSRRGNTPTSVETHGELLARDFDLWSVSERSNRLLRMLEMLGTIWSRRKKTSVLLIDTYSTLNFYYAVACARLAEWLGIPYIPKLHGGNLPDRIRRSPRLSRRLFGKAAINVAPSPYLYRAFVEAGYRVQLIPNSIEIDQYPFLPRKRLRPRLLYVRAFSRLYNPMMALEVLRCLREEYPEAQLCMVGPDRDGTFDLFRERCREMGLEESVEIRGKMEKADWIALSKEWDIFINTSNVDNMPVSLIEAMALGLPVITTDVGGIPDLIEKGVDALTVPAGDAEAMCREIVGLLRDPQRARSLAEKGRKKAERFDWQRTIRKQWLELLKEWEDVAV